MPGRGSPGVHGERCFREPRRGHAHWPLPTTHAVVRCPYTSPRAHPFCGRGETLAAVALDPTTGAVSSWDTEGGEARPDQVAISHSASSSVLVSVIRERFLLGIAATALAD
jgi:hypothetical protein